MPPCDAATTVYGVQKEAEEERGWDRGRVAEVGYDSDARGEDLDLLVTFWAARLWKEAKGDLKKPITWEDFKRIASGKTHMLSVGALGLAGASAAF
ncbi:hypothetical protein X797_005509 [Metarhizium robertsii]|uniref:Uncharacterized protein n=2 Tax=Metarhizium robertsii TaxID=568076 RepID=A0A0B2XID8_METRA|nr:uncharacterized protein MAA_11097 [Metarhizium robertsii ARSEF 23]EXV01413.1 hypothetical protein X797_005509 [Metarhizium robertsii]KHO11282.1 hypothetical protein MAA_11097 [Metarhizium robertsii ARSEF 23]